MAQQLPNQIFNNILAREGGYVNDPNDNGGETNMGITQVTYKDYCTANNLPYDPSKLQSFAKSDALDIYSWLFDKYGLSDIEDSNLADLLFDSIFNHGPHYPIEWAQAVVGINVDGMIGPDTISHLNSDPKHAYYGILGKRVIYYGTITQHNSADVEFIKGWLTRVAQFIKEI